MQKPPRQAVTTTERDRIRGLSAEDLMCELIEAHAGGTHSGGVISFETTQEIEREVLRRLAIAEEVEAGR